MTKAMRDGLTILDRTSRRTEVIADAMISVISCLEPTERADSMHDGCKFDVDTIEGQAATLEAEMIQSLRFIRRNWNEIIQNEMRLQEVESFMQMFCEFENTVKAFDECFCRNESEAVKVFNDWWIGRTYLACLLDWNKRAQYISDIVNKRFKPMKPEKNRFRNIARKFQRYFVGVKDADLEGFVRWGIPLPNRPKWLGHRCEATIMGMELGRSCKEMNDAFLIVDASGNPKKLNYSQDAPRMDYRYYAIHPLCLMLKTLLK